MPAIAPLLELSARSATNSTSPAPLQVVCAFPVSGQYGAGSRILYYVLVITCIFARKAEWLRGALLAAALVLPSVAAIHAIVLASTHVNGAVDMDIYGAFQFCSIAILAAPLTVRLSKTYFYDPGRNVIFLWTIVILAGLIALCVEFYRATPIDCTSAQAGVPNLSKKNFPYGNTTCDLRCSDKDGPFSPLRGGAASEIYVVPAPTRLSFNTGMLLAAGFCIPAILSLIFTWDKILEINWKRRREAEENLDEPVEGANVTVRELKGINSVVRMFLSVVEIPLFGGAVIAILSFGEANFFSQQVAYQTEPMAAVGQWAPIAGTVIAALGSLYLLWYKGEKDLQEEHTTLPHTSDYLQHGSGSDREMSPSRFPDEPRSPGAVSEGLGLGIRTTTSNDIGRIPTITEPAVERSATAGTQHRNGEDDPSAGRPRVRQWFTSAANYLGNAAHHKLDVSDYKDQKAHAFPEIPGEPLRNAAIGRISEQYTVLRAERSRAESTYAPSIASNSGLEGGSTPPTHASPRPDISPSRKPKRKNTLEVPTPVHIHRRTESH
ncbi:hypothetical protein HBH70_106560 [Parastagonospora nodorum]|nr:hypothetical protein HBH51_068580 [Parastagonospora nodorum]KAH4066922.1 hypothetical protein HBH50_144830 [Parastagonospora nodorum]KAH4086014.1 hypothetical protein HBH48_145040 [Parastagonospora nodorum]KAH4189361.1 hypothetical protein HBH42_142770 [Parastagonospora nodorum]KAH4602300.1 hypothetical protein HBH82_164790 [Parastagonospora nodorum]